MKIVDFTVDHLAGASKIARQSYEAEKIHVPALPAVNDWPDLRPFAENGLGVAALDGDAVLGFLCCVPPFENVFHSTNAVGVFSPMHANGTVPEHRGELYARMYQAAGEKWARAGASSHAVCLYAHDLEGQGQFFEYGFGLRCMDAVRDMTAIDAPESEGYTFAELSPEEYAAVLPLDHMLDAHMAQSPCFLLRPSLTEDAFEQKARQNGSRFFAAQWEGVSIAFLQVERGGETFLCDQAGYLHIQGAFCLPEHRGRGVYPALLSCAVQKLKQEGIARLGVDFESINPTAHRFWRKQFQVYTHSVVRRIDEHAVEAFSGKKI